MAELKLQDLMVILWKKFKQYACKDGDASSLSKHELCQLAKGEFPALVESANEEDILNEVLKKIDMDGNKKVEYEEFVLFFTILTILLGNELSNDD